ncbi:MAG: dipeptide epimerase [Planctomycetes bacterium]|nr:dipeptide epimerase [Planctomycetota bacterium]
MEMRLHVVPLRLRHTFTIAHGSTDLQRNLIVELRDGELRGFGEASTVGYYHNDADGMAAHLEQVRAVVESTPLDDPASYWDALLPHLAHDRFALCALDQAAHDLWGRRRRAPVWKLWGLDLAACPPSDYTIGLADIDVMVAKLRELPDFPIYKIKLGAGDDLARVAALRAAAGDGPVFRVDANCGWTCEQTLALAPQLAELGVELLEQPLAADDLAGQRRLFAESPLPVVADESCLVEVDVARCAGLFHGVNIKLTKCGGLTPARRMIADAKARGLRVMVGCMTESTVGISAIGQLLPLLDWADLDGALLLRDDVADGVRVGHDGIVRYPDPDSLQGHGLGVTWRGLHESPATPGA